MYGTHAEYIMKDAIKACKGNDTLKDVYEDFSSMNRIVEDSKRNGWNSQLPEGYRLKQYVKTRFSSHYYVSERFLKSMHLIKDIITRNTREGAVTHFDSFVTETNFDGDVVMYPAIAAITDVFDFFMIATVKLEASKTPTLHLVLPMIFSLIEECERLYKGGLVWREPLKDWFHPSKYTKELAFLVWNMLRQKTEVHPLWLAGVFMNPYYQEMQFVPDIPIRNLYRQTAMAFVRKLIEEARKENGSGQTAVTPPAISTNGTQQNGSSSPVFGSRVIDDTPRTPLLRSVLPDGSRKRTFSMAGMADVHVTTIQDMDEVNRYNAMTMDQVTPKKQPFLADDFAVIKFWSDNRRRFPMMYKVAHRVYAIPVSSAASERVFSAVSHIVTDDRSYIGASVLEDLTVSRSITDMAALRRSI